MGGGGPHVVAQVGHSFRCRRAITSKWRLVTKPLGFGLVWKYPHRSEISFGGSAALNALSTARTSMTSWLIAPPTGLK